MVVDVQEDTINDAVVHTFVYQFCCFKCRGKFYASKFDPVKVLSAADLTSVQNSAIFVTPTGSPNKLSTLRFEDLVTKETQWNELCQILDTNEVWRYLDSLGKKTHELD